MSCARLVLAQAHSHGQHEGILNSGFHPCGQQQNPIWGGLVFTWMVIGNEEDELVFLLIKEDNSSMNKENMLGQCPGKVLALLDRHRAGLPINGLNMRKSNHCLNGSEMQHVGHHTQVQFGIAMLTSLHLEENCPHIYSGP